MNDLAWVAVSHENVCVNHNICGVDRACGDNVSLLDILT